MAFKFNFYKFMKQKSYDYIQIMQRWAHSYRLFKSNRKVVPNGQPWLINTGETIKKGFACKYYKDGFLVYTNPRRHSRAKGATYKDIVSWHNRDDSLLFSEKLPKELKFYEELEGEVNKQIQSWVNNVLCK